MKRRGPLLIILAVLGIFVFSVSGLVSAQEIDLSNMDNAQLLQLLQAILQKLETDGTDETAEPLPDGTAVPVISVARFSDGKFFQIYENKKLILERIPDSYFFSGNNVGEDSTPEPGKTPGPKSYPTQTPGWEHDGIPEG